MKVLIVDDSAAIRTKLARFMTELGHTVIGEASNGFEAIDLFKKLGPELVTMDIVMPECDGIKALKEILKIKPDARIMMITSAATVANMYEAQEAGAIGFVIKPFVKDQVEEALKQMTENSTRRAG